MQCPRCNAAVDPQAKFCPECGASLAGDEAGAVSDPVGAFRPSPRAAHDAEEELWEGGYSPKAMVGVWVLLAVVSVALIVLAVVLTAAGTLGAGLPVVLPVVLGVIVLLWAIGGAVLLYRKWSVRYKLTSQRFVHRHGLFSMTTDRIELIDVDDITYQQGLVERMMGVGTIRMKSSDVSHPELVLKGIDQVHHVADMIDDARRKERRRRGIHIENV